VISHARKCNYDYSNIVIGKVRGVALTMLMLALKGWMLCSFLKEVGISLLQIFEAVG